MVIIFKILLYYEIKFIRDDKREKYVPCLKRQSCI